MDRGKHVKTDLVDFVPHPPSRLDAYTYLEEPMEVTFGQFRFCVEKEGSYRLEVLISSGLSAVDSDSSSGEEEISSPRFINTMASEKLAKIFSDMSFESSADSDISSDSDSVDSFNLIDRSVVIGKVFTDLYDGVTNPDKNQNSKYLQIYAIEETNRAEPETSEAFDNVGNPYVDPADLRRALSRFVARLGEKALPFYALIKQGGKFQWNEEADRAFEDLKRTISTPPILVAPKEKEHLMLYITTTPEVQVMNQCDAVNDSMLAYKEVYNELEKLFDGCEVNHISRLSNDEADVLANIGSQCLAIPPGVFWEEISERSTKPKKQQKKEKEKNPSGLKKYHQKKMNLK
ncbi:hypothetical protein QYE76_066998 [Lolium multiflorum]|uniref:RNase H type-1 domain-containing protein n=1 Tax=Lolium multiflorum TaxID=4521 RepID=A0AAD8SCP8_LOLMU|nr:hypothetical protein QYE76_066998 [Lolium multiflorum]